MLQDKGVRKPPTRDHEFGKKSNQAGGSGKIGWKKVNKDNAKHLRASRPGRKPTTVTKHKPASSNDCKSLRLSRLCVCHCFLTSISIDSITKIPRNVQGALEAEPWRQWSTKRSEE